MSSTEKDAGDELQLKAEATDAKWARERRMNEGNGRISYQFPKGGISQNFPVLKSSKFFDLCFMRLNWGGGKIGWRVKRQYQ